MEKFIDIIPMFLYFLSSVTFWIYLFNRNVTFQKLGHSFFGLGFSSQILLFIFKTINKGSLPLSDINEILFFLSMVMAMIFYGFSFAYRKQLVEFGSLMAPLIMFLIAFTIPFESRSTNIYHNFWFYMHVGSLVLSYGLIMFSSITAIIYIMTDRDLKRKKLNSFFVSKFSSSLEMVNNLEYKSTILAFIFLSIGLISSSVWTAIYVGKHWTWDLKQVLLSFLWLFYGFILHTRIIKNIVGRKASYLTLLGGLIAFIVFWLVGHPIF
ncbi:MAG: cytochrome c biogenesis protein [Hydrogenothermaceae bacterium]|nr:cytochrome c biogenesis protein [Hydrogenothermaceae bacterium]